MISGQQHIEACCVSHGCAYGANEHCPVVVGIVMQATNPCAKTTDWKLCKVTAEQELGKIAAIKALRSASAQEGYEYSYAAENQEQDYMMLALAKRIIEQLEKSGVVLVQKSTNKISAAQPEPQVGSGLVEFEPLTDEQWNTLWRQPETTHSDPYYNTKYPVEYANEDLSAQDDIF